jgi:hypothetical protein
MKRSIMALAAGFAALVWMSSCDKLDAPYAVIKTGGDTTAGMVRKVLLEDYTGHKCVNCPEAALAARALEESMHGQLIVMAVHAGFFAEPSATGDFTADYTSLTGNEWNTYFNITANPNGMVNRTPAGSAVLGPDLWANAVNEQISLPQEANIVISTDYDPSSRLLEVTLDTKFLALLQGTYDLTVCITEDSLISPQKNNNPNIGYPTPIIYDWVFMDVLRGSINGTWGEQLTSAVDTALTYRKAYTFALDPDWTANNCHIVAFVANAETKVIIQAEKKAVLSE